MSLCAVGLFAYGAGSDVIAYVLVFAPLVINTLGLVVIGTIIACYPVKDFSPSNIKKKTYVRN